MATKISKKPAKLKAEARAASAEVAPPVRVPDGAARAMGYEEIAEALTISVPTVRRMVVTGEFPQPDKRIRSRMLWDVKTFNDWFAKLGAAAEGQGG